MGGVLNAKHISHPRANEAGPLVKPKLYFICSCAHFVRLPDVGAKPVEGAATDMTLQLPADLLEHAALSVDMHGLIISDPVVNGGHGA